MAKSSSKGIASLLANVENKRTTKAKTSVPTIDAPESLRPHIAAWIKAKRLEKTAEENRKVEEEAMRETVRKLRVDRCRKDRQVFTTIALNGGDSGIIKAVQIGQFRKMRAEEHRDYLLDAFGDKDFARFFKIKTSILINADNLLQLPNGDKIAAMIVAAMGKTEGIKVESVIEPTEEYIIASVLDPKVSVKAELVATNGHAVPFALSFRE